MLTAMSYCETCLSSAKESIQAYVACFTSSALCGSGLETLEVVEMGQHTVSSGFGVVVFCVLFEMSFETLAEGSPYRI